jgi:hypothetical protein
MVFAPEHQSKAADSVLVRGAPLIKRATTVAAAQVDEASTEQRKPVTSHREMTGFLVS